MRGCLGGSSGGIGSFTLAAIYPEVFQAFADNSGDSAFDHCYLNDMPEFVKAMAKCDYDVADFIKRIPEIQPKDDDFQIDPEHRRDVRLLRPEPRGANGLRMPFDVYTGRLVPEVWAKCLPHDPVRMVARYADNLRKLRYRFVDCGTKDQFHLYLGCPPAPRRA